VESRPENPAGCALPEERIAELRGQLLAAVRRACPSWLASRAEDIVQTSILRVVAAYERSGGNPQHGASYIKRVAYNATVDEMRKHFRSREAPVEEPAELDQVAAGAAGPDDRAAALEVHEGLRHCLGKLAEPRRMAVACHLQGYSVPEAAGFLGWTRKKTEHLVRRGLMDLRTCLAGKGLTP
jgi:RNA polymerase sigma factor (sigma-70 family)